MSEPAYNAWGAVFAVTAILLQHHRVGEVRNSICLLTMTGAMCHVHVCSVYIVPTSVCMRVKRLILFVGHWHNCMMHVIHDHDSL